MTRADHRRFRPSVLIANVLFVLVALLALTTVRGVVDDLTYDVERLSRQPDPSTPCGVAVPLLGALVVDMGIERVSAASTVVAAPLADYAREARVALCTHDPDDAARFVRSLYRGVYAFEQNDTHAAPTDAQIDAVVCDLNAFSDIRTLDLEGEQRVDPLVRLQRAYGASASALARFAARSTTAGAGAAPCAWRGGPFDTADGRCPHGAAVLVALADAATGARRVAEAVVGATPPTARAVHTLVALALLAWHDRRDNGGRCFGNTASVGARALCEDALAATAGAALGAPTGAPAGAPAEAVARFHYARAGDARCTPAEFGVPPPPPPAPLRADEPGDDATIASGALWQCVRAHRFGRVDVDTLYGVPDALAPPGVGGARHAHGQPAGGLAAWWYGGLLERWFYAYRSDGALASPGREQLLYTGFRLGASLVWACPALCAVAYWFGRGAMPLAPVLLGVPAQICAGGGARGRYLSTFPKPKAMAQQWFAVGVAFVVVAYMWFVDPWPTPVHQRATCDQYLAEGGVWGSSAAARAAATRASLPVLLIALYAVLWECRLAPGVPSETERARAARATHLSRPEQTVRWGVVGALVVQLCDAQSAMATGARWARAVRDSDDEVFVAEADELRRKVVVLVNALSYLSFAVACVSCKWAFLERGPAAIKGWLLCVWTPLLVGGVDRWERTGTGQPFGFWESAGAFAFCATLAIFAVGSWQHEARAREVEVRNAGGAAALKDNTEDVDQPLVPHVPLQNVSVDDLVARENERGVALQTPPTESVDSRLQRRALGA